MDTRTPIEVIHNVAASRFEATVAGVLSVAEYRLSPQTLTFTHTLVPPEMANRGIASRLIEAGLAWARENNLKVVPKCRFAAAYLRRHPESQDLLSQEGRALLAP